MKLRLSLIVHLLALAVAALFAAPLSAQQGNLRIDVMPLSAPENEPVTIVGNGAPPHTAIRIIVAPYDRPAACRVDRGGSEMLETRSNGKGEFSITHRPKRLARSTRGVTYVARIGSDEGGTSNKECLSFVASGERLHFDETGYEVNGEFLLFWKDNGGLPVFGYPITDRLIENGRMVQYFERNRIEFNPQQTQPQYVFELGLLGAQVLEMRNDEVHTLPALPPATGASRRFAATGKTVQDQVLGRGFLTYWRSHGLELDGVAGYSDAESLALFGYPVTDAIDYISPGGEVRRMQWFERARLEWHPNNPDEFKVLLGHLGREYLQIRAAQPKQLAQVYLIAPGDNGKRGKPGGCGDSLVPVQVELQPQRVDQQLRSAIEALLMMVGSRTDGLISALGESEITVNDVTVTDGQAVVSLRGHLKTAGICGDARATAQLVETVRGFPGIQQATVLLNGCPLPIGERGTCGEG